MAFSIKGPLWPSFLEESIALQSFRGASAGTETFAVPLVAHYFQALCRKNKELIDRYALNRFATASVSANPTFLCAASVSATLVAELPARSLWAGAVRSGNLWCALSARALQIAEILILLLQSLLES